MRYEVVAREQAGNHPRPRRRTFFITATDRDNAFDAAITAATTLHGFTDPTIISLEVK